MDTFCISTIKWYKFDDLRQKLIKSRGGSWVWVLLKPFNSLEPEGATALNNWAVCYTIDRAIFNHKTGKVFAVAIYQNYIDKSPIVVDVTDRVVLISWITDEIMEPLLKDICN